MVVLKTKYKTFGFGDKAFDGVVDYLSKTVTDESQIETAIGGVEGLLKSFQLEVDFVRNEKWGLQKQLDELKAKGGNGKKGAEVASIDKTSKAYDVLTIKAAFGENIAKDTILFEATTMGGTVKKNTINFVLYDAKKVESDGAVLCNLLRQAYEINESKLVLPIHELDKVGLTSRFQFEY